VSYSEGFRKDVSTELRRGLPAGLCDGFERGCSDVARLEGGSRKGLREGCCGLAVEGVFRRSLVPKGFSKAVSKRVFREGASESFREGVFEGGCEGVFRKGFWEVLPEGFEGVFRRVSGRFFRGGRL